MVKFRAKAANFSKSNLKRKSRMDKLVDLYCVVDDFCQLVLPELEKASLPNLSKKRTRSCRLTPSEIRVVRHIRRKVSFV